MGRKTGGRGGAVKVRGMGHICVPKGALRGPSKNKRRSKETRRGWTCLVGKLTTRVWEMKSDGMWGCTLGFGPRGGGTGGKGEQSIDSPLAHYVRPDKQVVWPTRREKQLSPDYGDASPSQVRSGRLSRAIYEKACVSSPKFRFFCFVFRYVSYVLTKVTLQRSGRSRYLPPPDLLSQPLTCSPLRAGPVPVSHLFVVAYCAT